MLRFYYNEQWKEFKLEYDSQLRYAISDFGRIISFVDEIENGRLLKGSITVGYNVFKYKIFKKKKIINKLQYVHRLVALNFLPEPEKDQVYVLHKDYKKEKNHVDNLKWATKQELVEHNKKNPAVIEAIKKLTEFNKQRDGHKLTAAKVQFIKMKIFDPNRKTRLKMIAKQFGISEMQLYRIKTGENWGHVKIKEE
ncbi:MAG: HNH endonuclease [Bacteroidetes bacterium]|nr:HNH endonuclease [Bacteroidota bacterium]HET6243829.1 NUMOD4 domain-containing protein [Bacteroidia bacterium]